MNINLDKNSLAELNCWRIALLNKPALAAGPMNGARTAVVVVDMVNGFAVKGALASARADALIEPIENALSLLPNAKKIFLRDEHTEASVEFKFFPPHCATEKESAVVSGLKRFVNVDVPKNSTNGIFAFVNAVDVRDFNNFLVMGVCADICVMQFALSLQAFLMEHNLPAAVSVFTDYIDTYNSPAHNADLYNLFALKNMEENGIQIFKGLV